MKFCVFLLTLIARHQYTISQSENAYSTNICTKDSNENCSSIEIDGVENDNHITEEVRKSLESFVLCADENDVDCRCHSDVLVNDLKPFREKGITQSMVKTSAKYGTRYKILKHRLYRDKECMFPARCSGIEHFLIKLLPELPDMDMVINTRDWPQVPSGLGDRIGPIFSFSKTKDYLDIMYPAWTFWAGGPAISLHPTGIGRWDLLRESISKEAAKTAWSEKLPLGIFRGSRTSDERDALVLLSRRRPGLVDAKYTKNQAWKSPLDTLNAEPAKEVLFEDHCRYKYLFNFRGVAASFRFKHLFLCNSLVFHVGDEWNEFFYPALKPWVHYVPLKSYPSEQDIENIIQYFLEHDNLAREIAERGKQFIWNHLRMQDVECYWKKLLSHYQTLIKYKVVSDPELIPIKPKQRVEL
ncbi:O-glucosyltransferase rumi-like [Rhagoletis pomonella]|uniref:O-glucosyltransferase rumi-like n=1 Tax=Rhagoletis pomonella TaxID=28610 RepID=UPI001783F983|nr:O-glucosyltransferase rumi-like [Rhagoletis pomonella]